MKKIPILKYMKNKKYLIDLETDRSESNFRNNTPSTLEISEITGKNDNFSF